MDRIYSRKRIHIPRVICGKFDEKCRGGVLDAPHKRKTIKIASILIISILVAKTIINAINPVIDILCKDKAKSIATLISNEQATKVMKNYEYEDLMSIYKDTNDNITMIKANTILMNKIISDVAVNIQKELEKEESQEIYVRLGNISGFKFLAGSGPKIPMKISTVGNVVTDFKSEFKSCRNKSNSS